MIPKLFDYGKQCCTAYPRFVVQRSLFDAFLAAYLPAVTAEVAEPVDRGAVPLCRGHPEGTTSSPPHHAEPLRPVDTIVLVDTEAELLAAMNASNGALVATLARDDRATCDRLAPADPRLQDRARRPPPPRRPAGARRDPEAGGGAAAWEPHRV